MNNTSGEDSRDSGVLSNPLSFLRNGIFNWVNASLGLRGGLGYYWSLRSHSTFYSGVLYLTNTNLGAQSNDGRGYGFAVLCKSGPLQILHHPH